MAYRYRIAPACHPDKPAIFERRRWPSPSPRSLYRGLPMLGSGSSVFTEAKDFQASLQLLLDLAVQPGRFCARLTWVELPHLHLLRAREALPRVAHVSSPQDCVFAVFPMRRTSALICDGVA